MACSPRAVSPRPNAGFPLVKPRRVSATVGYFCIIYFLSYHTNILSEARHGGVRVDDHFSLDLKRTKVGCAACFLRGWQPWLSTVCRLLVRVCTLACSLLCVDFFVVLGRPRAAYSHRAIYLYLSVVCMSRQRRVNQWGRLRCVPCSNRGRTLMKDRPLFVFSLVGRNYGSSPVELSARESVPVWLRLTTAQQFSCKPVGHHQGGWP